MFRGLLALFTRKDTRKAVQAHAQRVDVRAIIQARLDAQWNGSPEQRDARAYVKGGMSKGK